MRYAKTIIPGIGLITVLILAAVRAPAEILIYAVLAEVCIFIITDPYRIIHYWLSTPARWLLVTMVLIDTFVARTHFTVEYVIIPAIITLVALAAIIRFNTDWMARRAYKEDPIIQKAMSMNEESSAWRSWIFHGREQCIEITHRIGIYTRKPPFNPADAELYMQEQKRIEEKQPVRNLSRAITVERMIEAMRMYYCCGYYHSISYKEELQEKTEQLESALAAIQELKEYIKKMELDVKEYKVIIADYEEQLKQTIEDADIIRNQWCDETSRQLEYKRERDNAVKNWQSACEYADELEHQIDILKAENDALKSEMQREKEDKTIAPIQVVGKSTGSQQVQKHSSNRRMTERDIETIQKLRSQGYKIGEIVDETGFSESTVKRACKKTV